jgi:diadenylate cyclase
MLQRTEMVLRIAEEIELDLVELGVDGRLFRLQLEEVIAGVANDRRAVVLDYLHEENDWHFDDASAGLSGLEMEQLLDLTAVANVLHLEDVDDLKASVQPKGYRMLSRIPRLPESIVDRIVAKFGSLDVVMSASEADLESVEGVGDQRARAIKEGFARLVETSVLDSYN